MALTDQGLASAIQTELAKIGNVTNTAELTAFSNALAKAIVDYIVMSATVVGTVTTGQGAGGQVTGQVV